MIEQPIYQGAIITCKDAVETAIRENGASDDAPAIKRAMLGLADVDQYVGGLGPKTLCILGAATNVGKSATLLHIAMSLDAQGFRVGIINLEDDETLVGERIQAMRSGISSWHLYTNNIQYKNDPRLAKAVTWSSTLRIKLAFPSENSITNVRAAIHALIQQGCDVILVDYFTAIDVDESVASRVAYNRILRLLKKEAIALNIPMIMAAQIQRLAPREDKKTGEKSVPEPDSYNLSETKFLEDMANVVILIWRDYDGTTYGKISKAKRRKKNLPKFMILQDPDTGRLDTAPIGDVL